MMSTGNFIKQLLQSALVSTAFFYCVAGNAATTLGVNCNNLPTPDDLHTAISTANANSTLSNLYTINISGTCFANAGTAGTFLITAPMILQQDPSGTAAPAVLDGSAVGTFAATRVVNVSAAAGGTIIDGLTIQNGHTLNVGGGILNSATGAGLTINNSTITQNTAGSGGGIDNTSTSAVNSITGSTVSFNSANDALGGSGGGLWTINGAKISQSLFYSNSATHNGGAVFQQGTSTPLAVDNSTFLLNGANVNPSSSGIAGAILITNGTINQSTFSQNSSTTAAVVAQTGIVHIAQSIIANSIAIDDYSSAGGGSIITPGTGVLTGVILLDGLHSNGGPTQTLKPLDANAIGKIASATCTALASVDQRGAPRPGIGKTMCDIGAYETGNAQIKLLPPLDTINTLDFVSTGSPVLKIAEVQNTGNSGLMISQATVSGSKFSFNPTPSTPITMNAQDIQDFSMVYTPTTNTVTSDLGTLTITNDTANPTVTVNLTGEATGFTPPITTQTIVDLLNTDLLNHNLFGEGPNSKSALNRYKAFINMITQAGVDINSGDTAGACTQLKDAAAKVDVPQNTGKNFFVGGVDPDLTTLYTDITTLISSLHCP